MRRDCIDYSDIPERQIDQHLALENWARSLHSAPRRACSAGFDGYRAPSHLGREDYAAAPRQLCDPVAARRTAQGVAGLDEQPRKAVQWYYALRTSVAAGRKYLGDCTHAALAALVIQARDTLRERGY